jgi:hypothetical protein
MQIADVVFVGVLLAFFGLSALYVRGLDRLVRSAEEPDAPSAADPGGPEAVPA